MEEDSGKFSFQDGCLCYESAFYGSWRIEAASIRLIGEYTNEAGPAMDDHFFVFFVHDQNDWHEASFYGAGRDETWKALVSYFQGLSGTGLGNSADFKSRVMWPVKDINKTLFDFSPMKRGTGVWHRILDQLFPPFVVEMHLRDEFKL